MCVLTSTSWSYGAYWSVLEHDTTPTTNPHNFNLNDSRTLVQRYNCTPDQIVLGVGLSACSWRGAREDMLPLCAYQGYLVNDPPSGCSTLQATQTACRRSKIAHLSRCGYKRQGGCWDEIYEDVHGDSSG